MTNYFFSQLVLNWYHEHGRKDLPWQKNKTLYKIWISEIMLQQTTVKTVIPYFQKFLKKFPNIQILSSSTLDEVLYLWSGLGYYARAKNIYKTSQIISKQYKGKFPQEFSKIIALPGIGKSTAGAILSFALNYFFPILDGNIRRVLIRYYGIKQEIKVTHIQKKLWKIIEIKTPLYNTGKFNQAMIDIGSLICKPKIPLCQKCPINKKCVAHFQNKWSEYTFKKIKNNLTKTSWFIIIKKNNNIWLEKNLVNNIWNNLFYFPMFNTKISALKWLKSNNVTEKINKVIKPRIHHFSHFTLKMHFITLKVSDMNNFNNNSQEGIWYNLQNNLHIGIPAPIKKIIHDYI